MNVSAKDIRCYVETRFLDVDFDDEDIVGFAAMPIVAYAVELWICDLDTLLRALPDELLFDHAHDLAKEFADWGDTANPETWSPELYLLSRDLPA